MNILLRGQRNIGKSTALRKTLDILTERKPLRLGGFFTWREGDTEPSIYMCPAQQGREREIFRLAVFDKDIGGMRCDIGIFEETGVELLAESRRAQLIIMDELGFLESRAPRFQQAVLAALDADIPVFGVMRGGDVPWHKSIEENPHTDVIEVTQDNRAALPAELAARLSRWL